MADVKPAWQTEELQDEWIDPDSELETSHGTRSISFTAPLSVQIRTLSHEPDTPQAHSTPSDATGGTFLVREDVPAIPFLPQTPGRQKKGVMKDIFSPLALERMFEPPS